MTQIRWFICFFMLLRLLWVRSEFMLPSSFTMKVELINLYSLHSWVELGTIVLYGVQWVSGFITFFFPGASPALRSGTLPWHVRSGLSVCMLALLAAELGFLEKLTFLQAAGLGRYSSETLLVNFAALVVILPGASAVLYVTAPMHNEHTHVYSAVHKP